MGKIASVHEVPIDKLKPYPNNAKKHGSEQIERIKASISEFGFLTPCLIDADFNLIAGHGRLEAAKQLGMKKVPCVSIEGLTEAQRKAYILADNRLGELGEWDMELVTDELIALDEMDFDIDLTGFTLPEEIEPVVAEDDDYDFKNKVEHRAAEGDIFQLGKHRLMCGDASCPSDAGLLTEGVLAKMVFTDPPYGVAIGSKNQMLNAVQKAGRQTENILGDTLSTEELYEMLKASFINIREHSAEDCSYYVTSPQGGEIGLMMMMMRDAGLEVRHNLIWKKNTATFSMRRLDYDYQHEPIFYTWTKRHNYYGKGQYHTTIWEFDKPRKCDLHPTMKPVELVAEALLNSSLEGDPVFDFFGGSGTTLIACEQLGRRCYMMEKDPKFVDVIIDRWEQLTGENATKVG